MDSAFERTSEYCWDAENRELLDPSKVAAEEDWTLEGFGNYIKALEASQEASAKD